MSNPGMQTALAEHTEIDDEMHVWAKCRVCMHSLSQVHQSSFGIPGAISQLTRIITSTVLRVKTGWY